jgi:hypothetical protein
MFPRYRRAGRRPFLLLPSRPRLEEFEPRMLPTTFTVTTAADSGAGSLRQAILDANAAGGASNDVYFNIASSGVQTITLSSPLPAIANPLRIFGGTEPGGTGTPLIVIDGSSAGPGATGLTISAGNSVVQDLVIQNFKGDGVLISTAQNTIGGNVISGNGANGVNISGSSATNNWVEGNFIGTNTTGTAPLANGGDGIYLTGTSGNTIGGTFMGAGNVISGNAQYGIQLAGNDTGNLVAGNLVGTDVNGTAALGNLAGGLLIANSVNNTVGGTATNSRNVISGNTGLGLEIQSQGSSASGNMVLGNYLGADIHGTAKLGNSLDGVNFTGPASNNTIGGTSAGTLNLISGNGREGIEVAGGTGNVVEGNYVGTDINGTVALGNAGDGVGLDSAASGNIVGGTTGGAGNVISGNGADGIHISTSGNLVEGNHIGTNAAGTGAVANGKNGVEILNINATSNTIGGTVVAARNILSGNTSGDGVVLAAPSNVVVGNYIGVDVSGDLALANANDVVIFSPGNTIGGTVAGAGNVIAGSLDQGIVFYNATFGIPSPAPSLVAGNIIGLGADGSTPLGNAIYGIYVALDSRSITIGGSTVLDRNVISSNTGYGIISDAGADHLTIQGNYIGVDATGLLARPNSGGIQVNSPDAVIGGLTATPGTGPGNVITANGNGPGLGLGLTLQPGANNALVQGNVVGLAADGSTILNNFQATGIAVGAANATIGGAVAGAANVASGNFVGINIQGATATGAVVSGNLIGTDRTGTLARGNVQGGVVISGAANNTVGGITAAARNVISGNAPYGLELLGTAATGNVVEGNYIGTNVSGTAALANTNSGVFIRLGATGNTIGGTAPVARNVISGNTDDGVAFTDSITSGNVIAGNYIGTDPSGNTALGNGVDGVLITLAHDNTIGGTAAGAGNVLSGNGVTGVSLSGVGTFGTASANVVEGNDIGTNAGGTAALPNGANGVGIGNGASGNTIGGTIVAARNIISGNTNYGVFLAGSVTATNLVEGNYIGTDANGTAPLANAFGVVIQDAPNNTVGGVTPAARNIVSGNSHSGIFVLGGPAMGNVVAGNYVGTDANGNTLISGTVAWYKGEGNGNDAVFGNNGTLQGGVTFAPGEVGQAFSFNGADSAVVAPNSGNIEPSTLSVALWVNASTVAQGAYLLSKGASGDVLGSYAIDTASSPTADLYFDIDVQGVGLVRSPAEPHAAVFDGHWHLVVGTFDDQTVRLYVDGTQVGTGTPSPSTAGIQYNLGTQNNLNIGNYDSGGTSSFNHHFQGLLDEVTVYSRPLSAAKIQGIFAAGSAGLPNALGNQGNGVVITSGATANTVGGTVAGAGNVISGQYRANTAGVLVGTAGDTTTTGNLIAGNLIGTDATGSVAEGNYYGVWLEASGNTVGGTTSGARNVISGNEPTGVLIAGTVAVPATGNVVAGNYVGTNAAGTGALSNSSFGIETTSSAGNTIGGLTATPGTGPGNVISGNDVAYGLGLIGTGDVAAGNLIGTNPQGTAAVGNAGGVALEGANNTLGGTSAQTRNVISGNINGLVVVGAGATGNVVAGNYIGTTVAGSAALPNTTYGIDLAATHTTLGLPGAGNVVSASGYYNLISNGADYSLLQGNLFGLNAAGTATLPGSGFGVLFESSSNVTLGGTAAGAGNVFAHGAVEFADGSNEVLQGNAFGTNAAGTVGFAGGTLALVEVSSSTVGGAAAGAGNVISDNNSYGLLVEGAQATGNLIQGNKIGTNAAGTAAIPNVGPGLWIDGSASGNTVVGNLISGNTADGVLLDGTGVLDGNVVWFKADGNTNNSGGLTAGISATINGGVTYGPGKSGQAFQFHKTPTESVVVTDTNQYLTATAVSIDAWINLNSLPANGASGYAIADRSVSLSSENYGLYVDNINGVPTLVFEWYNGGFRHAVLPVPGLTLGTYHHVAATADGTTVNFYLDGALAGSAAQTAALVPTTGNLQIGAAAPFNNTFDGLIDDVAVYNRALTAVEVQRIYNAGGGSKPNGTNGNLIAGNLIGTNAAGTGALGNGGAGITLESSHSNTIGGTTPGAGNVISSNSQAGILATLSDNTAIQGNSIGTSASGTLGLGNGDRGIYIQGSTSFTVTGTVISGNLISDNGIVGLASGVRLEDDAGTLVQGNKIGTDITGSLPLGNFLYGLRLLSSTNDTIGGLTSGTGNLISANGSTGLYLQGASGTVIQGNDIGTDANGRFAVPDGATSGGPGGILIDSGGTGNTIGGTSSAARNLISGNVGDGVSIRGSGTTGNLVQGNYVGTNATGTAPIAGTVALYQAEGNANDTSGNSHNGTIHGGVTFTSGKSGQAFSFAGNVGDYVEVPNAAALEPAANLTVDMWVKGPAPAGYLLAKGQGDASGASYAFYTLHDGLQFYVHVGGGFTLSPDAGPGIWDNNWHHIAGTYDGSVVRLYVDGVQVGSGTASAGTIAYAASDANASHDLFIGNYALTTFYPGGNFPFKGQIDDVGVYNRTLSGAEIAAIYSAGSAGKPAVLGNGANGVHIFNGATGNTIGGSIAGAGNVISGQVTSGGVLIGGGNDTTTTHNLVAGNFLGTDAAGARAEGNLVGVWLEASGNTVGGTSAAARNVVSGNTDSGVRIEGTVTTPVSGNFVEGNYVGTDATGSTVIGNPSGIETVLTAGNTIGGLTATPGSAPGNLISGNIQGGNGAGVWLRGSNDVVMGNLVGLNAAGAAKLGNDNGIDLSGTNNVIGGTTVQARNVISGNNLGIYVTAPPAATGNLIEGNYVGTNPAGSAALGNSSTGIVLYSGGNTIGAPGAGNVVSGNGNNGIGETVNANNDIFQANLVGTDATGTFAIPNANGGISLTGSNDTIGGTAPGAGNVVSGNQQGGIFIGPTTNELILGNLIGTDIHGTAALGNIGDGILLEAGAQNCTVGGTTAAARNVISGNTANGVDISDSSSSGNIIDGDYIGIDVNGTVKLGNVGDGIFSEAPVTIGGLTTTPGTGAGNVISGNGANPLHNDGNVRVTSSATIQGNIIGLDRTGSTVIDPTTQYGIWDQGGSNVLIGGNNVQARNIISGMGFWGVIIQGGTNEVVAGNDIGTDITGMIGRGNGSDGITMDASNSTIGGTTAAARNVISDNGGNGISLSGSATVVEGNYIGVDATGAGALGNGVGVVLSDGANGETIGGTAGGAGNVISANSGNGVGITGSGTTGNVVAGNVIGTDVAGTTALANGGSGVEVSDAAGNTVGGAAAGVQNVVTVGGHITDVYGILVASNGDLIVADPYNSQLVRVNPRTGTQTVVSSGGHFASPDGLAWAPNGDVYVADSGFHGTPAIIRVNLTTGVQTVISSGGSLVSPENVAVAPNGQLYVSDGSAFGGIGAIFRVDPTTGNQTVLTQGPGPALPAGLVFDAKGNLLAVYGQLPGGPAELDRVDTTTGVRTPISSNGLLLSPLGLAIDQDGSLLVANVDANPGPGDIVRINPTTGAQTVAYSGGALNYPYELAVASSGDIYVTNYVSSGTFFQGEVVRIAANAARNIISGNAGDGVQINGSTSTGNVVAGNFLGVDATGAVALANLNGVGITDAVGNTIGGTAGGAANIISGNTNPAHDSSGVYIHGTGSSNVIEGNLIGTNAAGTGAIPNDYGVFLSGAEQDNVVGGTTAAARNVISGNRSYGLVFLGGGADGNTAEGNYFGTDPTGNVAVSNGNAQILVNVSNGNRIGGAAPGAGNLIAGGSSRGSDGIWIVNASSGNVVQGNRIGTNAAGTAALGNLAGVAIDTASNNNLIGGTAAGARNLISGNTVAGVEVFDAGSTGNVVQGNLIGTNAAGTGALGNVNGVTLGNGASGNTVGGTIAAARNVISGNSSAGVKFPDGTTTGNVVAGNYIGTDTSGTAALGNFYGLFVDAPGNTIGGTAAGAGNVISANTLEGVGFAPSAVGDVVQGNLIGTNAAGSAGVGNQQYGVYVGNSGNHTIGGTAAGAGNIISANTSIGIYVSGSGASGNLLMGNFVGTNASGANLGNHGAGVLLDQGAANNSVGGPSAGMGNTIAFNTGAGVALTGSATVGDSIRGNSIHGNTHLGIDLGNTGTPLVNDSLGHVGPNNYQDYPVLTSFTPGLPTVVNGSFGNIAGAQFTLDLYANPAADPSGYGQGQIYLGSALVTTGAGGAFTATVSGSSLPSQILSATATDPGDTSEFSPDLAFSSYNDTPPQVTISGSASALAGISTSLSSNIAGPSAGKTYTYAWNVTQPGNPAFSLPDTTVTTQPNLIFTPPTPGTYVASLAVMDNFGAVGTAAPFTVFAGVPGPGVVITNLAASDSYVAGSLVDLDSVVSEPTGATVTSHAWVVTLNGAPFTPGTPTNTHELKFTPTVNGLYGVSLGVTDDKGGTAGTSVFFVVSGAAPIVILGAPPQGQEGRPITLTGSVEDAAFSGALTYQWSVSGSDGFSQSQSGPADSFTFTPDAPGTFTVTLKVIAGSNSTTTTTVIPVGAAAPTVKITSFPASGTVGKPTPSLTEFDAPAAANDPVVSRSWSVFSTGAGGIVAHGSGTSFSYTPSAAGLDVVTLIVTAQSGANASTSATIPVSLTPVKLTLSGTLTEATSSTLSASVNNPATGVTYTFKWTVKGEAFPFTTSGSGASFAFTPPTSGAYLATVTATGSDGTSGSISQAFPAAAVKPSVSLNLPTGTVFEGTPLTLSASVVNPGGSADQLTYKWTVTGPDSFSAAGSAPTLGLAPVEAGSYPVTLTVTDVTGVATTATGSFTITHVQPVPTVMSTGLSLNGSNFQANLKATVPDPGADDAFTYTWSVTQNGSPFGTGQTGSSPSFTLSGTLGNSYVVSVQVTDDEGGSQTTSVPFLVAGAGTTLSLSSVPIPAGATQVLAVALANATIDAGGLSSSMSVVEAALGGHDLLKGGPGPSVLQGDSGFNTLQGGSGPDTLIGTANDSLVGGTGSSNLFQVTAAVGESVQAGTHANSLSFAPSTLGVMVNLSTGAAQDSAGDPLSLSGAFQTLIGGSGNDTLMAGTASNVVLMAGSGNANLSAAGGSGIGLFGGTGNDSLSSSGGTSITLVGGSGNTTLSASAGTSVTMFGGTGNDSLSSSGGTSVSMVGGGGNSTLSSSGGTSVTMFGGTGNDSLSSSGGTSVSLVGGGGNSTLSSSGGTSVTMFGGTGNDSLSSSGGTSVSLVGGGGNSTLSSSGGTSVTMFGGTGNDSLSSSGGTSVTLIGGGGNSTLSSSGGSSVTMFGGTGGDSLSASGGTGVSMTGGSGNSTLSSSGGSSVTMFGGTGNSSLSSSGSTDVSMTGGSGNSTLSSSGGSSVTMFGGTGNDSLSSSGGTGVSMTGGSGNSTLSSSGGSSVTMFGGTGNDSLSAGGTSGGTSVSMVGGTGNSTLVSSGGTSVTMFGGTGNDSLSSSGGTGVSMVGGSGNSTLASSGGTNVTMFGGTGNSSLSSSGGTGVSMTGGSGNSTLASSGGSSVTMFGGTGNDSLSSTSGSSVTITGGTGNDTLTNTGGTSVTMFGGTGNSSLSSSGGTSVTITGGTGNDTLTSTGGSSVTMFGGTGSDSLSSTGGSSVSLLGGTGNDTLRNSGGTSVTMFGGTGNDSLSSTGGTSVSMTGGSGNSTLASSGGTSVTLFGGTGNDSLSSSGGSNVTVVGGTGNDTLSMTNVSGATVIGGTGSDSLSTTGGTSVTMFGGTGNDSLSSTAGSTVTVVGGTGKDNLSSTNDSGATIIGGSGNDTLTSNGGTSVTLFGGTGSDSLSSTGGTSITLIGGTGNSTLTAGGGSNVSIHGGSGNDTLSATGASSVTLFGGTGNDSLSTSGGSVVTLAGGTGTDTLSTTGGTQVLIQGGIGNDTLSATGGTSVTMFGGTGNDSLSSSGATTISMNGGSGNDTLTASGNSSVTVQAGGGGNDSLVSSGGTSVTMFGGSGNDTLSANGGSAVGLAGEQGNNTYAVTGSATNPITVTLNDLATFGQSLPQEDGLTPGINTILFPGVNGNITLDLSQHSTGAVPVGTQVQAVATGITLSLIGAFQNVNLAGDAGNDLVKGDESSNVFTAGSGMDTLIGGSGPATLVAGSGNDSLVAGTGGTTFEFAGAPGAFGSDTIDPPSGNGLNLLDFSQFGGAVTLNLGSTARQTVSGSSGLALTLQNPTEINALADSNANDNITGNSAGDLFFVGKGNDTFTGGGGADSFFFGGNPFAGSALGSDVISEPATSTSNTLNFYGFDGPVNLNLKLAGTQTVSQTAASNLKLTLPNPAAFNTVVGSTFGGTIVGNDNANESLIGGGGLDSLVAGAGNALVQANVTQVVYLSFPSQAATPPGSHVYTTQEENAVLAGLQQTYADFNYFFTLSPTAAQQQAHATGGQYATIAFDGPVEGGAAFELDLNNHDLGGLATVNVSGFLGDPTAGLVAPTESGIIGLTTTIAAHELGHLSGLQHQNAISPIGGGLYAGINPTEFSPTFSGPQQATETAQDIMASPDSVGTTLANAAAATSLGERDAIVMAFNDTGTVLQQANLATQQAVPQGTNPVPPGAVVLQSYDEAGTIYQVGTPPALAVPNPLPTGTRDYGKTFNVSAVAVNAGIAPGQVQYFAISATPGQVMTFQIISATDTLNPSPILPALEVLDASGNVVAFNIHEFESGDSTLLDVTLPGSGSAPLTYYVGVLDQVSAPVGYYQLFMYSFAAGTGPSTGPGDTLVGGGGNDTLVGSSGNNQFAFAPGSSGHATLLGGSGQDYLTLAPSPAEQVTTSYSKLTVTPGILLTDAGGPYTGLPFPATATVTGINGVTPGTATFTYYAGTSASGTPLSGAPVGLGTYTVVASFTGSGQYTSASAQTTFSITLSPANGTSVFVLSPSAAGALTLSSNAQLKVTGPVEVDSKSSSAIAASGGAGVSAASIQVVGQVQVTAGASLSPSPVTGAASFGDPLSALPVPLASTYGLTFHGSVNLSGGSSLTISQGIYSQITVSGGSRLTLNPGIYVIAGGGFSVSGNNSSVSGANVMIYNAGSNYLGSGNAFGGVNLSGTGSITLSPPTTGPYSGILIFQSRDNTSALGLSGSGIVMPGGVIYAPAAGLSISGSGQFQGSLVVGTLALSSYAVAQLTASNGGTAYAPVQVRTAYGINNVSLDGTGQTIAVVDAYDNPDIYQSLDAFDAQFAVSPSGPTLGQLYGPASTFLTVVNESGQAAPLPATDPAGAGSDNWEVEEALDLEWMHAVAPGAKLVLVEAGSQSLADLMTGVATAARLPGVSVVSMSWGFVEGQNVLAQDEATYDPYFTTPPGHAGVTFVASAGDYGAGVPEYPAMSPNVVAVGGTTLTLNTDNSYKSEVGWGAYSGSLGLFLGSGGGPSRYEAEPAYQRGVQSTGSRTTPDVSLLADPATGAWIADPYNLGTNNPWEVVGGTSLSAPAWAGLLALADQGRVTAGKLTLGSASPTEALTALYGLSRADYHDVTSGNNGYSAGAGYDFVTGLGTPVAGLLVPDLVAYAGGSPSATPVAPIAAAGLVFTGSGTTNAQVTAAVLSAFGVRVVAAPESGTVRGAVAVTEPIRAVSIAPVAAFVPGSVRGVADVGTARLAVSVNLAGTAPADVLPVVHGILGDVPTGSNGPAAWEARLLDPWTVTGPAPGRVGIGLRPEMPADDGRDVLVGGAGDDVLVGGEGDNLLVGGYTADEPTHDS